MTSDRRATRREVLRIGGVTLGAIPLAALLAACGNDDTATDGLNSSENSAIAMGTWNIASRWIPTELVPGEQRLPVSLADSNGLVTAGPQRLTATLVDLDTDEVISSGLFADRRTLGDDTIPFWVFRTALDRVGTFALVIEGGPEEGAAFQTFDPSSLAVARTGQKLPAFDTPTLDDPRGVEEVCTRTPEACPFHSVTLTEAMNTGKPVVYLVGTPAHCQTGVCGPVLEQLIPLADELGDSVVFVHADVYADRAATVVAPAVEAANLTFEPVLFVTDANGVIVERLDAIWDVNEVKEALS
jgi:hypothetical protein